MNVMPLILIYVIQKLVSWIEQHRYKFEPRHAYTHRAAHTHANAAPRTEHDLGPPHSTTYRTDFPDLDLNFYHQHDYEFEDDHYESFTD